MNKKKDEILISIIENFLNLNTFDYLKKQDFFKIEFWYYTNERKLIISKLSSLEKIIPGVIIRYYDSNENYPIGPVNLIKIQVWD